MNKYPSKSNHYIVRGHKICKLTPLILPQNIHLRNRAKSLRKAGNIPEVIFWKEVHRKKFYSIDFDRQKIIGNYIVDFYLRSLRLVIEIDGSSHNDKENYDQKREGYLRKLGLEVYRISAQSVKFHTEEVMLDLEEFIIDKLG